VQAVDSPPLAVASILCKKLAEGLDRLVLDVKCGSGSFTPDPAAAHAMAETMVQVATGYGVRCRALVTDMSQPLGRTVGNALEVVESIETLQGGGPDDLRDLVVALAGDPRAADVLASGAAFETFEEMVAAQGGDAAALRDPGQLRGGGTTDHVLTADRAGHLATLDALSVGIAAFKLGAGRREAGAAIDFGVGITLHAKVGDAVAAGQPLLTLHHRDGHGLDDALERLSGQVVLSDAPVAAPTLIHEVVEAPA